MKTIFRLSIRKPCVGIWVGMRLDAKHANNISNNANKLNKVSYFSTCNV